MLGPLLFVLYAADLSLVANVYGIGSHFYADDTQLLYLSCRRADVNSCRTRLTACIEDIASWLSSNRLMLNPLKTEMLCCSTNGRFNDAPRPIVLDRVSISPVAKARVL